MAASLPSGVDLLNAGRLDDAAAALAPLAGASREGVIARFRRAESLSRLGRHDEAVEEARRAYEDDRATSPPALWLAQTLAEAGRHDEAAAVELPATSVESLDPLRDGYRALARIAARDRKDADATVKAVLDTCHSPLFSLALRLTESQRVAAAHRGPDLPTVWYRIECRLETEHAKLKKHPATPALPPRRWWSFLTGGDAPFEAARWVRDHCACGDFGDLVARIRAAQPTPPLIDEAELEMLLALDRLDDAHALAERLANEAGADAAGELAVDRARIAQLRGEPARPRDFAGHEEAAKLMAPMVAWLETTAALMEGDALAARTHADRVADPSRREFVQAALERWKQG